MGIGKNDKINFQGFVKKKKPKKEPDSPEKFSHTLTFTRPKETSKEEEQTANESGDEDTTSTNVNSPSLVLPRGEDLPPEERKHDHWKDLSNTFVMVLASILVASYLLHK